MKSEIQNLTSSHRPDRRPGGSGGTALRVTALVVTFASLAGGCANANRPLNAPNVPLEARAANDTRAATFARTVSPAMPPPSRTRPKPQIRPGQAATEPADDDPQDPAPGDDAVAPPPDADGCFVGLALSGGGSRSANFSAACMFQLQRLGLLQRVDYISTVSGGSLPGACYCLYGPDDWNPGTIQRRLTHSFATDLIVQAVLLPWNWAAFAFTPYDRTDVLALSFQRTLFTGPGGRALTFGDLRPDRPRLLVNATDLQSGRRFVFCNETFDDLNSDLSKYPVAYAVAASSSVPVALHPVTLRDYSTAYAQYRHLIDGGVNDNLGVLTLVETYTAHVESARRAGRPDPYPNGAVFVVVDAHTYFDARISDKPDVGVIESLKTAAGLSSTALVNRASSATLADLIVQHSPDNATAQELRSQIDALNRRGYLELNDRTGHPVRVVYLSLSQVNGLGSLPFQTFSESVNSIETYFNISDTEAYHLYLAADLLMREKFEGRVKAVVGSLQQFREGGRAAGVGRTGSTATSPATAPIVEPGL